MSGPSRVEYVSCHWCGEPVLVNAASSEEPFCDEECRKRALKDEE